MSSTAQAPKDPKAVSRGRAAMRARWAGHVPKSVVSIASLTEPQRVLVMALVNAARREAERDPATPEPAGSGQS